MLIPFGLGLIAASSPLLTFTALFQQKEWRLDRLREHLRRDGWLQLTGTIRPILLLLFFLTEWMPGGISDLWLLPLALLSPAQMITRKQRFPVWTKKTLLITALSSVLLAGMMRAGLAEPVLLPVVLLLSPLAVLLAWLFLLPLDMALKRRLLQQAAALRASLEHATVIAVAGSVGKTTVKELTAHLLQDRTPFATPQHVNTELGVAQWMLSQETALKQASKPLLIVEMGAYRRGEIRTLCRVTLPDIGILTAIGSDHLGLFGSEEEIVRANAELIESLPEDGLAVGYGDNDAARSQVTRAPCRAITAGMDPSCDLQANAVEERPDGLSFTLNAERWQTSLHGLHQIGNMLCALAAARHLGMGNERLRELLATFTPLRHTFNVRQERGISILDDTYNISPLSLRAVLAWAAARTEHPTILLTAGLLELGGEEDRFHETIGREAQGIVDRVIFTGERGRAAFAKGFGAVEVLSSATRPPPPGSLLLCVGRLPKNALSRLLRA